MSFSIKKDAVFVFKKGVVFSNADRFKFRTAVKWIHADADKAFREDDLFKCRAALESQIAKV